MSSETRDDDGVGLIEIVVAMLLLAVLALGILPLIIQATTASVVNRDLVAANNVAADALARLRTDFPSDLAQVGTCGDLETLKAQFAAAFNAEDRTVEFAAELDVVCPDPDPTPGDPPPAVRTSTVTVYVYRGNEPTAILTAVTKVMVSG